MAMTGTNGAAVVQRLFDEVWNEGRLDMIGELVDRDFVNFGRLRGQDGLKVIVAVWRTAFPDLHIDLEEEIVAGDMVVQRVTCSGTHHGEFRHLTMGVIPATGRHFSVEQIHIFKLQDGKIVEHRACRDDLGMLQQLGRVEAGERPIDESRSRLLEQLRHNPV